MFAISDAVNLHELQFFFFYICCSKLIKLWLVWLFGLIFLHMFALFGLTRKCTIPFPKTYPLGALILAHSALDLPPNESSGSASRDTVYLNDTVIQLIALECLLVLWRNKPAISTNIYLKIANN